MSMEADLGLVIVSLIYMATIILIYIFDKAVNRDVFSAVKIVCYFSFLEWLSMFWFSLRADKLYEIVLGDVVIFQDEKFLYYAYGLSVAGFILAASGAALFSYRFRSLPALTDIFIRVGSITQRNSYFISLIMLFLGFMLFGVYIYKFGGISFLWENLERRTVLSAGLGYFQAFYNILCVAGGALLSYEFLRQQRWGRFLILYLFVAGVLIASGGRYYLGLFTFLLLLIYHFHVSAFRRVMNKGLILVAIFLLGFMLLLVQMRMPEDREKILEPSQVVELLVEKFEQDVIKRFGVTERQVTVLTYFDSHDYWYGASYLGLIQAYQLRSNNPDKPPVDTGIYLRALADGYTVKPPVSASNYQATSWPEGNLSGYMNFGLIGFAMFSFLSGGILGGAYHFVRIRPLALGPVLVFGFLGFMGAPSLSPYGIFAILKLILVFFVFGWFAALFKPVSVR